MKALIIFLLFIIIISCEDKEKDITPLTNKDSSQDSLYVITDLNSNSYDIRELTKTKNVLIYSCAPWCIWCVKDIPVIEKIDSLCKNKILILYFETSKIKDTVAINNFINTYHLKFPFFSRQDNPGLWRLVNYDNKNLIPRISLFNSKDSIIFDHIGYDPSITDTIAKILK